MKSKVVLLLGAGASVAMGYPIGHGLRKEILLKAMNEYRDLICGGPCHIGVGDIGQFVEEFGKSQLGSIDAFLARRPVFSEVGKRAIAAILLHKENSGALRDCSHEDNWYFYFFNQVSSESWDNFDLSNISIITFNYDRSFEHYLLGAICSTYGRSEWEALEKMSAMQIVHVYGSLGAPLPTNPDYFHYGSKVTEQTVSLAARSLKVIAEGRNDGETLVEARQLLIQADAIGFMGFGYDPENLARLDSKNTCALAVLRSNGYAMRFIRGTCLGMTKAEIHKAISMTVVKNPVEINDNASWFHATGCLQFLRETLILDRA